MKTFKYKATKTSQTPQHVHDTMFLEGEVYFVTARADKDDEFVTVSGKFGNSLGGWDKKEQGILKSECREYLELVK